MVVSFLYRPRGSNKLFSIDEGIYHEGAKVLD